MNHISHDTTERLSEKILQAFIGACLWICYKWILAIAKFCWKKFREQDSKPLFIMYCKRTTAYILLTITPVMAAGIFFAGFYTGKVKAESELVSMKDTAYTNFTVLLEKAQRGKDSLQNVINQSHLAEK